MNLWGQCFAAYQEDPDSGELTIEEKRLRDKRNSSNFLDVSYEYEILYKYFEKDTNSHMTAADVQNCIYDNIPKCKIDYRQLKKELKRMFGVMVNKTVKNKTQRGYGIAPIFPVVNSGYNVKSYHEVDRD